MTIVFTDPRYQPKIRSRCHPTEPIAAWLTADGKGMRIECQQCGMLIVNFKIKSPIIRQHRPEKKK